jgi:hypothetical protein
VIKREKKRKRLLSKYSERKQFGDEKYPKKYASAVNRTRGPSMATMDFTTKPLMLTPEQPNYVGGVANRVFPGY